MKFRSLIFAALGGAFILSAAVPAAYADRDDHRGHFDRRDDHRDWHRGYAAPPVVVAPAYGYYAPPPVAYGPAPGLSIGINIP